ncbi:MAG TPA: CoA-binding protein [archaeon]|nr:CoA-binding protein [archaeon]
MQTPKTLEPFFSPKTVAVIGVSNKKGKVGYTIFENLKKAKIKKLFAINPKHKIVQGKKSYPSIQSIPQKTELGVIVLPSVLVPKTLEECMKAGMKAVIIISAGFSETGEKKLTKEIAELIRKNPQTRVIGPNCVGITNNMNNVDTTFFEKSRMKQPKKGNLSFISQSGALGAMILDWVATQEFGINKFASYGNAMDVDEADLLEYFGEDKGTKVITAYLEGARDGKKFFKTAKKVSKKKPIIILKGGKHEETTKAAASHTGSLAGSSKVYEAVFKQAGIIEANDLLDLFNIARILEKEPLPKGNRVQIITNGGGFGIVTADQIIQNKLELAKLSKKTIKQLKKEIPNANIGNPLDLLGDATISDYKKAITSVTKDPNVDILIILILFNLPTIRLEHIKELNRAKLKVSKPAVVCSIGSGFTKKYLRKVENAGFTTIPYPTLAAQALKELAQYSKFLKKN